MNAAINIGVEDMTATIVRYGLYLGAAFQLLCLFACVCLNNNEDSSGNLRVSTILLLFYIEISKIFKYNLTKMYLSFAEKNLLLGVL